MIHPIRPSRTARLDSLGGRLAHLARPVAGVMAIALMLSLPITAAAAGPPFPEPVDGQAVYDNAGILSEATVAGAEATIDAIEERGSSGGGGGGSGGGF